MKLSNTQKEYMTNVFRQLILFERHDTIMNEIKLFLKDISQYLIDGVIYTDDYENQSKETPLLIPNVNFIATYEDDYNKPFELVLDIKDEKLILVVS